MHPSPGSRSFRRWAARLTLLVACIGTVATSKVASPPITAEYQGETLRLTAASPTATRRVVIRASAKDSSDTVGGDSSVELVAHWRTTTPSPTDKPSLRVRWRHQEDDNKQGTTHVLDAPGQASPLYDGEFLTGRCELDENCEWPLVLDVEAQGVAGEDVVEVDWKVIANVEIWDKTEQPEGFQVHISEP